MNAAWMYTGGKMERAIQMQVMKQPGANTIEVSDAVKALFPAFQAQLPPSVHFATRGDRAKLIRDAFTDFQVTMGVHAAAGGDRDLRVPAQRTGHPDSGAGAALLDPGHAGGDGAAGLQPEHAVDDGADSLGVLRGGRRHRHAGEHRPPHRERADARWQAAFKGSKEIGFTILSMTLSLAAVFIPILFMSGMLGRMFREFAVTICTAILVSGVVSITLTPMLCSRLLREGTQKHGIVYRAHRSRLPTACCASTTGPCAACCGIAPAMAVVFFAVLGATWFLYQKVPKGFIPDADNDQMQLNIQAAQGTSFYKMVEYQKRIADIVRKDPDVEAFMTNAGNGNSGQRVLRDAAGASRAKVHRAAGSRAAAAENFQHSRVQRVPERAAAHPHRRRRLQLAQQLRFHAAGSRHRRAVRAGGAAGEGSPQGARGAGRQHRPGISRARASTSRSTASARRCTG